MTQPVLTVADKNRIRHLACMEDRRDDALIARERRAEANRAAHLARMEERRLLAVVARQVRAAAGIAKRDRHNAYLAEIAADLRETNRVAAQDLAMLLTATATDNVFGRIANLARANGVTTVSKIAKLDLMERMSVEGRVLAVIEQKLGVSNTGSLGTRVDRLEALAANDDALPLAA